jgi:hypothetical protein
MLPFNSSYGDTLLNSSLAVINITWSFPFTFYAAKNATSAQINPRVATVDLGPQSGVVFAPYSGYDVRNIRILICKNLIL